MLVSLIVALIAKYQFYPICVSVVWCVSLTDTNISRGEPDFNVSPVQVPHLISQTLDKVGQLDFTWWVNQLVSSSSRVAQWNLRENLH